MRNTIINGSVEIAPNIDWLMQYVILLSGSTFKNNLKELITILN